MQEIETQRLQLKPVGPADCETLHRTWTHPAVRKHLWDDRIITLDETISVVVTSQRLFADRGFGIWGAWIPDETELAGFGGFWFFRGQPNPELVYGVAADRWGSGLATEIGRALVCYGFRELGFEEIRASTDVGNVASVVVLERIGFSFERRAIVNGLDTLYYQIPRSAFPPGDPPYTLQSL